MWTVSNSKSIVVVVVVVVVVRALGTIPEKQVKWMGGLEIRGIVETVKTTALLKSPRVVKNCGDLLSLGLEWKLLVINGVEQLADSENNDSYNCNASLV